MKKTISLLLALVMCLSLCACGGSLETSNINIETTIESTVEPENNEVESKPDEGELTTEETEPKIVEVSVAIVNNNGETEHLSGLDLNGIYNGNQVMFNNKYLGASVTVVSEVLEVHDTTIYDGHMMEAYLILKGGWLVEVADEGDVAELMPGDVVKVTGSIYSANGFNLYLYIINGNTTTIEPYTE